MAKNNEHSLLPHWLAMSPLLFGPTAIYKTAINIRNFWYDTFSAAQKKVKYPVISIGGIRAGGTGKTPSAIFVGSLAAKMGYTIAFLSRGYRRKSKKLQIAKPFNHLNWELIGDEPAMIHRALPQSWLGIHADRFRAATYLEKIMPQNSVFIIDDGFQHRQIARDLDIVCLHDQTLNDFIIPKGYLREPVSALSRAHAVFIIGNSIETDDLNQYLKNHFPNLEVFNLIYKSKCYINTKTGKSAEQPPHNTPVALCGIARPERFFKTLYNDGIRPCKEYAFPDHYRFSEYDIRSIQELYSHGLLTTEKDAIRLLNDRILPDGDFWYLKMDLCFASNDSLNRFNKLLSTIFN